jgi:hypothetical protein
MIIKEIKITAEITDQRVIVKHRRNSRIISISDNHKEDQDVFCQAAEMARGLAALLCYYGEVSSKKICDNYFEFVFENSTE